jgi:hypothetical protein
VAITSGPRSPPTAATLGTHFSRFLIAEAIDTPVLCADPATELRSVALRYLAFLRQLRAPRTGAPLSTRSIGGMQAIVAKFYAFMADHQREGAELLGEPRWLELTDAHGRFWRDGELRTRRSTISTADYIEPEALARIVEHLDIVGMPTTETKTVLVDEKPVEIPASATHRRCAPTCSPSSPADGSTRS